MNRILTVAQRELTAMIATKAFLVTLVMMPVLMAGGAVVAPMLSKIEGGKERKISIIDHTNKLAPIILQAAEARNDAIKSAEESTEFGDVDRGGQDQYVIDVVDSETFDDSKRLEFSKRVTDGDLYAFAELPVELYESNGEPVEIRFVSTSGALSEARQWLRQVIRERLRTERLDAAGIDPATVAAAEPVFSVSPSRPYKADAEGKPIIKDDDDVIVTLLAPLALMGLMFLVIFLAAQPMLESAMEEKTQKIAEVMLGNVSPRELLTGKLLGNVAGSLIVFLLYASGGLFILYRMDMMDVIPSNMLVWFVVFQILGVLLFSSVFMVIGASVNQLKEAQSLLIPVWLVLMIPLMVWFNVIRDPNGILATALSFFPPSAPLMCILRLGTGAAIPAWHLPVSALLLMLTTAAILLLASRIYRASLLRSDGATTIMQILRRAA